MYPVKFAFDKLRRRTRTDITGMSGLRIPDAILPAERAPVTLARLCHGGVKSREDTIAKSLEGDYRPEHLFALRQSLAAFHYYQQLEVAGSSPLAPAIRSCGDNTVRSKSFDVAHGRLAKETAVLSVELADALIAAERESSLPLNRFSHNLVLSILHACVAQAIRVAIGWQQEDIPWKCGQLIGTEAYGRLPVMQEGRDKAHVERSRY